MEVVVVAHQWQAHPLDHDDNHELRGLVQKIRGYNQTVEGGLEETCGAGEESWGQMVV